MTTSFEDALSVVGIDLSRDDLTDEEREILKSIIGLETGRRKEKAYTDELVYKAKQETTAEPFELWSLDERLCPTGWWTQAKSLARKSCGLPPDRMTDREERLMLRKAFARLTIAEAARLNRVFR